MQTRRAVFAGSWYPADPEECRSKVESFFRESPSGPPQVGEALGGIVPHAGWVFSGRIAGAVIGLLRGGPSPETVLLFGGHLGPRDPPIIMSDGAWETPLGPLHVDRELALAVGREFSWRQSLPHAAEPDNTMELQLPLIKHAFPSARVLPLAVAANPGATSIGKRCAELVREAGKGVRVVGSTDLTHYGPGYGFTPVGSGVAAEQWVRGVLDRQIIRELTAMNPEGILDEVARNRNACCPGAAAAAVACAKELGARVPQLVAYGTSGDVMPGEDFVGYAGVVYWSPARNEA